MTKKKKKKKQKPAPINLLKDRHKINSSNSEKKKPASCFAVFTRLHNNLS